VTTLIFDCDGVLADTERDGHLVAFNGAFADLGMTTRWSVERYGELLAIGGGKERLRMLRSEASVDPVIPDSDAEFDAFVADLHRIKTARFIDIVESGGLPGRPGVARIVHEALDAGWTLAVASTSAESSVRAVLRSVVGEADAARFAGVFAGDIVAHKKPAPDIYLHAVELLGADLDDTLVVEDSSVGATASATAGLATLVTVSGFTAGEEFPAAAAVVTALGDPGDPGEVLSSRSGEPLSMPVSLTDLGRLARSGLR
jgi:HAD superfamily hydrolase (TIGR01509 family)